MLWTSEPASLRAEALGSKVCHTVQSEARKQEAPWQSRPVRESGDFLEMLVAIMLRTSATRP